jgi:hypothetical protein
MGILIWFSREQPLTLYIAATARAKREHTAYYYDDVTSDDVDNYK